MAEIKTKKTFGGARIEYINPPVTDAVPTAMNVHLTFGEALKLHFGLGQLLAKLNSYNRSTSDGRRAAVNLCVYPQGRRITINEGRLRKTGAIPACEATGGESDGAA